MIEWPGKTSVPIDKKACPGPGNTPNPGPDNGQADEEHCEGGTDLHA